MHDPKTVVRHIELGDWYLVTIWHVDPETDGTDDSCGWFRPPLTESERAQVEKYVECEYRVIVEIYDKWSDAYRMPVLYTLYQGLKWHLWRKRLNRRDMRDLMGFAWNICDDIQIYDERPEQEFRAMCFNLARHLKRARRKWFQHPRWHVHHWEFQVHPIDDLKRWLFSRCARCGRRFSWGYAPIAQRAGGSGPRWFKGEDGIYHHDCTETVFVK